MWIFTIVFTERCPAKCQYWKIAVLKHNGTENASTENVNFGTENAGAIKSCYRKMLVPGNFLTGNIGIKHASTGTRKY